MPNRVQRKRTPGWRAPLDDQGRKPKYVGRGTWFGNPWAVVRTPSGWAASWTEGDRQPSPPDEKRWVECDTRYAAHETAINLYAEWIADQPKLLAAIRTELAGRDLMCWCAPELPCHADVLIATAAGKTPAQPPDRPPTDLTRPPAPRRHPMTTPARLTDQQLNDIDARHQAATDGPWMTTQDDNVTVVYVNRTSPKGVAYSSVLWNADWATDADAEFAAHARTDVPALVAELRQARAEIDRLRDALAKEERLHGETIDDRDHFHDMADKLAYAVAPEEVIGEHSSMNCPWDNALDLITPKAEVDRLRAELAAKQRSERAKGIAEAADVVDAKLTAEPDHNRASALYEVLLHLRGELPCTCARSQGLHEKCCRKYVPGHELLSPVRALAAYRTERAAAP